MKVGSAFLLTMILLGAILGSSPPAIAQETSVTAGAVGIYPPGTTFNGVPVSGLESGYGIQIASDGSARGQFCTVLVGISLGGLERHIKVEGRVISGSRTAANVSTFTGSCTVDMGDGTPPTPGVPFTATVTTDANDQGSIGLVIGSTTFPNAVVNEGSMSIE